VAQGLLHLEALMGSGPSSKEGVGFGLTDIAIIKWSVHHITFGIHTTLLLITIYNRRIENNLFQQ
jgi:hypothetical protein